MDDLRVFRRSVLYLIGATKGGMMRVRIMRLLFEKPYNSNQLAELLDVDYKTIRHHIDVLLKNNWITKSEQRYGEMYFPAFVGDERKIFEEISAKIGNKL
ncbi:MAG TPA: winged helix-turn-helix domain-containing protein [archaeon]|nr:winged helix-turn-helix domain-containing protein [archaeon]